MRQLETEKRNLERKIQSQRSKSYERGEKAAGDCGGGSSSLLVGLGGSSSALALEQENRDLKLRIRRLEAQLAEKEAELARHRSMEHTRYIY